MDPLQAELTPPHQGKGVRFLRRSREGGSQRESGGGKEKKALLFENPAPKINLVEAHLKKAFPTGEGMIALYRTREAETVGRGQEKGLP
jgi:hypothetical protein